MTDNIEQVGINTPNVYTDDDGVIIYRASSLGGCLSCLVANRLGYEAQKPPDWLQKKFNEGHDNEETIINLLAHKLSSEKVPGVEVILKHPSGEKIKIVGHTDGGLLFGISEYLRGVEAKALGKTYVAAIKKKGLKAFPHYGIQLSIYMHAMGIPFEFVVGVKDENGKVNGVEDLIHVAVEIPPYSLDEIWAIVDEVERLAESDNIPIAPVTVMCTHPQFHTADDMELMEDSNLTDEQEEKLVELGRDYEKWKAMEKVAKETKGRVGKEIAALMKQAGIEKTYDSMVMRVTLVPGRNTYPDLDKMRENGIDVDAYMKTTLYTYPKVTDKIYGRQAGGS